MVPLHVDPDREGSPGADGGKRLDSWKEIAAYLNRDVATVRRWEKREALPVHRHRHDRLGSVYAFASELAAWQEARRQKRAPSAGMARLRGIPKRVVFAAGLPIAIAVVWTASSWLSSPETPPNGDGAALRAAASPEVNELYMKGRLLSGRRGEEDLRKAVAYFESAIKLDSAYAPAHAGLADAYASWANATVLPAREAYLKAKAAALDALQLDGQLAEPHTTLGVVSLFYDWDWPAAERSFTRAIALQPQNARAHRRYSVGLAWMGRFDEALSEARRARELAPVDLEASANVALLLYFARRYDQAIREARATLELDRQLSQSHRTIARASLELRDYNQAISAFEQAISAGGIRGLKAELGHAYALSGQRARALTILDELDRPASARPISACDLALLYTGLGDHDKAFEWLDKSFATRERCMVSLKVAPSFDPLRADPRFAALMSRVGLWSPG